MAKINSKKKLNCWEYHNCGQEQGGHSVEELGLCPVSVSKPSDGTNCGVNAGRICWSIDKSLCKDKKKGGFSNCLTCDFYNIVRRDEGFQFKLVNVKKKTKFTKDAVIINIGKKFTFLTVSTIERKFIKGVITKRSIEVVLDFKKTRTIDSSALGLLLTFKEYLHKGDHEIPIINANKSIRQTIKRANFDRLFNVEVEKDEE